MRWIRITFWLMSIVHWQRLYLFTINTLQRVGYLDMFRLDNWHIKFRNFCLPILNCTLHLWQTISYDPSTMVPPNSNSQLCKYGSHSCGLFFEIFLMIQARKERRRKNFPILMTVIDSCIVMVVIWHLIGSEISFKRTLFDAHWKIGEEKNHLPVLSIATSWWYFINKNFLFY